MDLWGSLCVDNCNHRLELSGVIQVRKLRAPVRVCVFLDDFNFDPLAEAKVKQLPIGKDLSPRVGVDTTPNEKSSTENTSCMVRPWAYGLNFSETFAQIPVLHIR